MDPRRRKLLDRLFNFIVNFTYGPSCTELPNSPEKAFQRWCKILKRRTNNAH